MGTVTILLTRIHQNLESVVDHVHVILVNQKTWSPIMPLLLSHSPRSGLVPMEAPTLEVRLPLPLPQQHKVVMTQQQLLATVTVLVGIWIPAFLFVLLSHQTFSKTVFNNACKTVHRLTLLEDQNTSKDSIISYFRDIFRNCFLIQIFKEFIY